MAPSATHGLLRAPTRTGTGLLSRWVVPCLILVVAVVVAALVPAVPAGAAPTAPGPVEASDPRPTVDTSSTTTSTSTTTTTSSPAPEADGKRASNDQAGPPELARRGIVLPSDSFVAALSELSLEQALVSSLLGQRTSLEAQIEAAVRKVASLQATARRDQAQRVARAVAIYRAQSTGWQLGVLTTRGLDDERALYLVGAADVATRRRSQALDQQVRQLRRELALQRARLRDTQAALGPAVRQASETAAKLAANGTAVATVAPDGVYVPTGPSPIALAADAANRELMRIGASPRAQDRGWLAAQRVLAVAIASTAGGSNRNASVEAIESDWNGVSQPVMQATLFALRQVGKAYVYATAGPDTFDCSGLTKAAYAQIGLGLPHFSGAQLRVGTPVPAGTLRPGDLLAYGSDGSDHIAMYVGGGIVVAAKGRAYGVVVERARVDPTQGFAGATRIVL